MSSLLAFHAHPDDESVSTGVTLAKYADEGHRVVVATATDGSAGEIHNYDNPEELFPKLCLLYTSPSPRDATLSRMPSSA